MPRRRRRSSVFSPAGWTLRETRYYPPRAQSPLIPRLLFFFFPSARNYEGGSLDGGEVGVGKFPVRLSFCFFGYIIGRLARRERVEWTTLWIGYLKNSLHRLAAELVQVSKKYTSAQEKWSTFVFQELLRFLMRKETYGLPKALVNCLTLKLKIEINSSLYKVLKLSKICLKVLLLYDFLDNFIKFEEHRFMQIHGLRDEPEIYGHACKNYLKCNGRVNLI